MFFERDAADERVIGFAEDEERMGFVVARVFGVAAQLVAIGAARGFVLRPGGLPRRQEIAAGFADIGPFLVVAQLRRAEVHALPVHAAQAVIVLPHQNHDAAILPQMP